MPRLNSRLTLTKDGSYGGSAFYFERVMEPGTYRYEVEVEKVDVAGLDNDGFISITALSSASEGSCGAATKTFANCPQHEVHNRCTMDTFCFNVSAGRWAGNFRVVSPYRTDSNLDGPIPAGEVTFRVYSTYIGSWTLTIEPA